MFGVCEADRPIFPKKKAWFHGRGCEDGAAAQTMQKNESDRCQISTQAQAVFFKKKKTNTEIKGKNNKKNRFFNQDNCNKSKNRI